MAARSRFHLYVTTDNGLLKGVDTEKKVFTNLNNVKNLQRGQEITSACWGNNDETEICLGLKNQTVKIFDTNHNEFIHNLDVKGGAGVIVGLQKYEDKYLTCMDSGIVQLWDENGKEQMEIDAGSDLQKMSQNPLEPNIIATGGKENDLKVWDLQNPGTPIFMAKNVRNDFLGLRVPICVLNMKFLLCGRKIVTTTAHHQIRVYDPNIMQKRPVIDMEFDSYPIGALSTANEEHQIIVGNSHGRMALFDLRKKRMVHVYKGFAGSIRDICYYPAASQVFSCGLDRFLRIHDLETHQLLAKMYLKSSLNNLLICTKPEKGESSDEVNKIENVDRIEHSDDELWNDMEIVSKKKRKKSITDMKHTENRKFSPTSTQHGQTKMVKIGIKRKKKKKKIKGIR